MVKKKKARLPPNESQSENQSCPSSSQKQHPYLPIFWLQTFNFDVEVSRVVKAFFDLADPENASLSEVAFKKALMDLDVQLEARENLKLCSQPFPMTQSSFLKFLSDMANDKMKSKILTALQVINQCDNFVEADPINCESKFTSGKSEI